MYVREDSKQRNMDGGIWVLLTFLFGVLGLIGYLIVRESHPETFGPSYTPQQKRYYETIKKAEKNYKEAQEEKIKNLYISKGREDSLLFTDKSFEELRDIVFKIYEVDASLFEVLPPDHMNYIENENYRSGYIDGLNNLILEKKPKETRKSTI